MGSYDGTLTLLENRDGIFVPVDGGTPWGKPADAWTTGLGAILLPNFTHPALADLDEDGDLDMLVGAADNALHYFENTGNPQAPRFALVVGHAAPLGLSSLLDQEAVRLRLTLGLDLLNFEPGSMPQVVGMGSMGMPVTQPSNEAAWTGIASGLVQAIQSSPVVQGTGVGASVYQLVPGSVVATFELFVVNHTLSPSPLAVATELGCAIERQPDSALNATAVGATLIGELGLLRVHRGGYLERLGCPQATPPPTSPPMMPIQTVGANVLVEVMPSWLYPVIALALLLLLLLLCLRYCMPAIMRGFCGRWCQLNFTHSNEKVPPLYLPMAQRLAVRAYLQGVDGTKGAEATGGVNGMAIGWAGDAAEIVTKRVMLQKSYPNQPLGLQLIDLISDAQGWRRTHGGGGTEYYVHAQSRTALAATPHRFELAPRVLSLQPGGLAALSTLQLGDAVLAVDDCQGDASFLTEKLEDAPAKVELLIERAVPRLVKASDPVKAEESADSSKPARADGRRDPGWVDAKVGWWQWAQEQGVPSAAWLKQWSREVGAEDGEAGGEGGALARAGNERLTVPSAETRLGAFGVFQLRRELRPKFQTSRSRSQV